jgi:DNA-binding LytR/AlgR family response regulator
MNCIIIDDDQTSRLLFEKYINKVDYLNLKYSFSSAIDAINLIKSEEEIDLIFLDIEMPEMNGIEFINNFNNLPQIIIVSAQEKYALNAFEYDVTDYLLKPVSYARFYKAASKAYEKQNGKNNVAHNNDGIFIKSSSSSFIRLRYDDILWLKALENYVVIHTQKNKHTIHFTMKAIYDKLPSEKFLRVHRSYIVNINKISLIRDNTIIINNDSSAEPIPIAKTYKEELLKKINILAK